MQLATSHVLKQTSLFQTRTNHQYLFSRIVTVFSWLLDGIPESFLSHPLSGLVFLPLSAHLFSYFSLSYM